MNLGKEKKIIFSNSYFFIDKSITFIAVFYTKINTAQQKKKIETKFRKETENETNLI